MKQSQVFCPCIIMSVCLIWIFKVQCDIKLEKICRPFFETLTGFSRDPSFSDSGVRDKTERGLKRDVLATHCATLNQKAF